MFKLSKAPLPTKQELKIEDTLPKVKCHCCNDTGKIQTSLVKMVIENYDPVNDKDPICLRKNCGMGLKFISLIQMGLVDTRFTQDMCDELHEIGKSQKEKSVNVKPENCNVEELIEKMSMKKGAKFDDQLN